MNYLINEYIDEITESPQTKKMWLRGDYKTISEYIDDIENTKSKCVFPLNVEIADFAAQSKTKLVSIKLLYLLAAISTDTKQQMISVPKKALGQYLNTKTTRLSDYFEELTNTLVTFNNLGFKNKAEKFTATFLKSYSIEKRSVEISLSSPVFERLASPQFWFFIDLNAVRLCKSIKSILLVPLYLKYDFQSKLNNPNLKNTITSDELANVMQVSFNSRRVASSEFVDTYLNVGMDDVNEIKAFGKLSINYETNLKAKNIRFVFDYEPSEANAILYSVKHNNFNFAQLYDVDQYRIEAKEMLQTLESYKVPPTEQNIKLVFNAWKFEVWKYDGQIQKSRLRTVVNALFNDKENCEFLNAPAEDVKQSEAAHKARIGKVSTLNAAVENVGFELVNKPKQTKDLSTLEEFADLLEDTGQTGFDISDVDDETILLFAEECNDEDDFDFLDEPEIEDDVDIDELFEEAQSINKVEKVTRKIVFDHKNQIDLSANKVFLDGAQKFMDECADHLFDILPPDYQSDKRVKHINKNGDLPPFD